MTFRNDVTSSISNPKLVLEDIVKTLNSLAEQGANRFDPAAFGFLESLLAKCQAKFQQNGVVTSLLQKAFSDTEKFERAFLAARDQAAVLADQLEYEFPASKSAVESCFESSDFSALDRLALKLRQHRRLRSEPFEALCALSQQLSELSLDADDEELSDDLQSKLRQQEQSVLSSLTGNNQSEKASPKRELKSIRVLREFQKRQHIDDLVDQCIREKPENPGPINPHMLAIKSLVTMRELSTPYLDHFVSYMDTLFALEAATEK